MTVPLVSVVMPSYNHAPFVRQSIESVLAQRGVDFELLIEDDGSTDGTRDVIAQVRDSRIRFEPREHNFGASETVNRLLRRARGEYVALINSDDAWRGDDKLAFQLEILESRPSVGACFGRAEYIDEQGRHRPRDSVFAGSIFEQPNRTRGEWLHRFFTGGNCLCHPTVMIRRRCYEEVGFYDNRLRQIPDFLMWTRLAKHYDLHVAERALVDFRVVGADNASSMTAANLNRLRNEEFLCLDEFFDGVDLPLLREGFSGMLSNPQPRTAEEIEVEKTLLFYKAEGPVHWTLAVRKLHALLASPRHRAVLADYSIDERWLQDVCGRFSPFHAPPAPASAPPPPARPSPAPGRSRPLLRYLGMLRR